MARGWSTLENAYAIDFPARFSSTGAFPRTRFACEPLRGESSRSRWIFLPDSSELEDEGRPGIDGGSGGGLVDAEVRVPP